MYKERERSFGHSKTNKVKFLGVSKLQMKLVENEYLLCLEKMFKMIFLEEISENNALLSKNK